MVLLRVNWLTCSVERASVEVCSIVRVIVLTWEVLAASVLRRTVEVWRVLRVNGAVTVSDRACTVCAGTTPFGINVLTWIDDVWRAVRFSC